MRIAIVGGGAAGMMAAATINENNPKAEVFLLEKNDILGKKVMISGGGRCNVTTGLTDIKLVLTKYPRGGKFLNSAMHIFPPAAVSDWFVSHGVPLKCEADGRVFPVSNNGQDIVNVFNKIFSLHHTKILFKHSVQSITKKDEQFIIYCQNKKTLTFDKVILALGGQAYRQTGSTGDGYSLAESLGHEVSALAASLSSLMSQEAWPQKVAGVSLVKATLKAKASVNYQFSGPMLFTHWGISGPAVFALSSLLAFEKFSEAKPLQIHLDILPDLSLSQIISQLQIFQQTHPKKSLKYNVQQFVPLSLANIILEQAHISLEKKNNQSSPADLYALAELLKNLPLHIVNKRAGDEFVTAGGVNLKEIDPASMQSKLVPGLYLAGEILDIDGFTGGFNLQAAWCTGYLAGLKSSLV